MICDLELEALDLDGEWDPEKHDAHMMGLYGQDEEGFEDVRYLTSLITPTLISF